MCPRDGPERPSRSAVRVARGTERNRWHVVRFTGYASVVGKPYEMQDMAGSYNETVDPKAFNRTLEHGADVSFLCNHGGVTMARTKAGTLKLSADATGLYTEATLNPSRGDVQIVRAAVADGDLDEMSMAIRVLGQDWDAEYENRLITQCSLHKGDVSVVNTQPLNTLRAWSTFAGAEA